MQNDRSTQRLDQAGFTLLETIIALSVAALIIATLIPISRSTIANIVALDAKHQILSRMSSRIYDMNSARVDDAGQPSSVILQERRSQLPPFTYENSQKEKWQPVLIEIDAGHANGVHQKFEFIRLERQTP